MKLVMRRKGFFKAGWGDLRNKCGTGQGQSPTYYYECIIETPDILDSRGFVFNQLEIDKYFQTKYTSSEPEITLIGGYYRYIRPENPSTAGKSCEQIALAAVHDIKQMIESHMLKTNGFSNINRIAVTISFNDAATMTAEWTPEKPKKRKISRKIQRKHDIRPLASMLD